MNEPNAPKKTEDVSAFEFDIQTEGVASLSDYKNLYWTYAGNDFDANPDNNGWIFSTAWTGIDFKATDDARTYSLTLTKGDKTFVTG